MSPAKTKYGGTSGVDTLLGDIQTLENELSATQFAQQCQAEIEAERKANQTENTATEIIQVAASAGAGALSQWRAGGFPVGAALNTVLGGAAKVGSIWNPESRALRVACRSGKVLLHSQISIFTADLIKGRNS